MKRNKRRRKCPFSPLTLLAALLLIGGMLAVVLPVLQWDAEVSAEAGEYEQLREQNRQAEARETVEEETLNQHIVPPISLAEEGLPVQQSESAVGEQAMVDLSAYLAQNPDFVAWLRIPGTNVDYPVVQTDNSDYYLNHTFSGKSSVVGTLFSLADADYAAPGRNIAIYGHHLRSSGEKMFTSLMRYKNPDFYEDNKTVMLDSLYRHREYTIFAVMNMKVGDWEPSRTTFSGNAAFMAFVNRAKSESLYDTGVEVGADDHILTLITCDRSYAGKEGRLVILAVER
jgi:sortase B